MKTGTQFVRKLDPKIGTANRRVATYADRVSNLETPTIIREKSRERSDHHKPARSVARYLELARRARMVRSGMVEALELREELLPLDLLLS